MSRGPTMPGDEEAARAGATAAGTGAASARTEVTDAGSEAAGDGAKTGARTHGLEPFYRLAVPALLVLLYAAARTVRLVGDCLWFDEIFGVHAAGHDWRGLWSFVAADLIHPPLFYALLKLWVAAGGESILWLELFAYATSLLCLVPFLLLARELRLGPAATGVALLLFAASGYFIKYAQEVRMYALLLLLTLTSLWLFARLAGRGRAAKRRLLWLALVNLLLVYTHYYGWLVVCGEAAYLTASREWGRLRSFLPTLALAALCFAPWAWACVSAAGEGGGLAENVGWIERPTPADAVGFYALLHEPFHFRQSSADPLVGRGGTLLGALTVGLPVLLLVLRSLRRPARARETTRTADTTGTADPAAKLADYEATKLTDDEAAKLTDDEAARLTDGEAARLSDDGAAGPTDDGAAVRFLSFFALFPVAVAFAASYVLPHAVWGARHLMVAAAPYALLAGLGVARLRPRWLRAAALSVLVCWYAVAGLMSLARPRVNFIWCAWGQLAGQTFRREATAAGAADVYAFEDLAGYQLWHELRGEGRRFRVRVVKGVGGITEDPSYFLPRRFPEVEKTTAEALSGERFWVAFRDASFDETRPPLATLRARGYRVVRRHETAAQGQVVFLLLVEREGEAAPPEPQGAR